MRCGGCGARWERISTDCRCTPEGAYHELHPPVRRLVVLTGEEQRVADVIGRITSRAA